MLIKAHETNLLLKRMRTRQWQRPRKNGFWAALTDLTVNMPHYPVSPYIASPYHRIYPRVAVAILAQALRAEAREKPHPPTPVQVQLGNLDLRGGKRHGVEAATPKWRSIACQSRWELAVPRTLRHDYWSIAPVCFSQCIP